MSKGPQSFCDDTANGQRTCRQTPNNLLPSLCSFKLKVYQNRFGTPAYNADLLQTPQSAGGGNTPSPFPSPFGVSRGRPRQPGERWAPRRLWTAVRRTPKITPYISVNCTKYSKYEVQAYNVDVTTVPLYAYNEPSRHALSLVYRSVGNLSIAYGKLVHQY